MSQGNLSGGNTTLAIVSAAVVFTLLILVGILVVNGKSGSGDMSDSARASALVGKPAPDFELEDFDGNRIKLSNLKGKNVILFFSEGLMCYPACWDQMAKLGSDARFNNETAVAYSIIMDPKSEWQKAFDKMPQLRRTKVLFDSYGTASRAYDVLNLNSSMHKGIYPGHTYFLIDKEGTVRFFYDDPTMGIRNDMIYDELKKLNS